MDVQQQASNGGGHAPYFEMMSDKCKSPTAALTCPDTPKDHSVLPSVLKNSRDDEYCSDTAGDVASSPVPETSAVPHSHSQSMDTTTSATTTITTSTTMMSSPRTESDGDSESSSRSEKENTEVVNNSSVNNSNRASSTAYSIAEILNAGSGSSVRQEKDMDATEKEGSWPSTPQQPPTEQQLKSNLPPSHPLKEAVKSNIRVESPDPAASKTAPQYHPKDAADVGADSALLRKKLTDTTPMPQENGKQDTSATAPKALLSPSAEQYNAWLLEHAKKVPAASPSSSEPDAKKLKISSGGAGEGSEKNVAQLSPSVASSYLQGQAAASLWYQNMAAAAATYPYPGPYTDPVTAVQIQAMYPGGYLVPGQLPVPVAASPTTLAKSPVPTPAPAATPKEPEVKKKRSEAYLMHKDHDKLFQCMKCPRNFSSSEKLLLHELTHPYAKPFNCGLSLKRKHEEPPVKEKAPVKPVEILSVTCLLCGEQHPNQAALQVHVSLVHRKQRISASSSPGLKEESSQYYRCSFCNKYLPNRLELMEHEKVHLVRSAVPADSVKSDLATSKEHERKHHSLPRVSQVEYPDPVADIRAHGKMLQECLLNPKQDMDLLGERENGLGLGNNNNSMENNGNLDYACPICQKQFISSKLLKSHVKYSHLEERPYTCSICSKSFKQKATLKQHEKLHSDEKPYVCSICSRGFVYPSRLKTHSQTCKGDPGVMSP